MKKNSILLCLLIVMANCLCTAQTSSVSGVYYVPANSSDFGAAINTIVNNDCPTGYGGYKTCTIVLPQANAGTWATTAHIGPGVNLQGQGQYTSTFSCTAVDCLLIDYSGSSGIYAHTVNSTQDISRFSISGDGAAGQSIIHGEDVTGAFFYDITLDNVGNGSGACIKLEDINYWTERNTFLDFSTGLSCSTSWLLYGDASNPHQPHPSFGYNRLLDVKLNPTGNQVAFAVQGGAYFYNSTIRATINSASNGNGSPIIFELDNSDSQLYYDELHIYGEGQAQYFLDLLGGSNQFVYSGEINFQAGTGNNITPGAVVTHLGDNWAYDVTGATTTFGNPLRLIPYPSTMLCTNSAGQVQSCSTSGTGAVLLQSNPAINNLTLNDSQSLIGVNGTGKYIMTSNTTTPGFSGTAKSGTCTLTISNGVITAVSGC